MPENEHGLRILTKTSVGGQKVARKEAKDRRENLELLDSANNSTQTLRVVGNCIE